MILDFCGFHKRETMCICGGLCMYGLVLIIPELHLLSQIYK